MYFKKILVPYDGSKYSRRAFEKAVDLAKNSKAKIKVLTCIATGYGSDMAFETRFVDMEEKRLRDAAFAEITKLEESTRKFGISVSGAVVKTISIPDKITGFAKSQKSDLIVMGSHGRTGFKKLVLGSVTNHVLSQAPCPVLVIK
ncbi:MAG: universal stress protein [Nitrosopumilaceae archaeon]|jgi:nucleotide-binding universal stress UspA family protein